MLFRYTSSIIQIGNLQLGGRLPLVVQSMTNTDTNNINATVAQTIQLAEAGCQMVRITAQGITEAQNLALIKKSLRSKGYHLPLVADIHFNPKAAEAAAAIVEKVRINPGNYVDKRETAVKYTDVLYNEELERVAGRLRPLLEICKTNGAAIRIGVNHGSLSGRIMERYGDTPEGMVESALEFGRICKGEGFDKAVFSMKSSNVRIMVSATRLLARQLQAENINFPIHLGVTEAGDAEDGIIKSAAGIGTLLENGIGDTLRVSLTGDPVIEIPVALAIAERYNHLRGQDVVSQPLADRAEKFKKRETIAVSAIGGNYPSAVLAEQNGQLFHVNEAFENGEQILAHNLPYLHIVEGNGAALNRQISALAPDDKQPIILKNTYDEKDELHFQVNAAIDCGSILMDGRGDALYIQAPAFTEKTAHRVAFAILQATRARITRTEFIACPSCGRTLFNLEESLKKVKEATSHLKGLKVAVMGCIVNGPGEMADADYGYVGAGPGLVTLYKGKEVMVKNIPQADAVNQLIELIRQSGDWKDI